VRAEPQELLRARRQRQRLELRQDVDLPERAVGLADLAPQDRAGPPVDDRLADLRVPAAGARRRGVEVVAGGPAALEDEVAGGRPASLGDLLGEGGRLLGDGLVRRLRDAVAPRDAGEGSSVVRQEWGARRR
jgi:hypothetical protein